MFFSWRTAGLLLGIVRVLSGSRMWGAHLIDKVLMLSAHSDEAYIVEAVKSGAMGYLIKQTSTDNVCHAIREVQKRNTYFSPSIPSRLHRRNQKKDGLTRTADAAHGPFPGRNRECTGCTHY